MNEMLQAFNDVFILLLPERNDYLRDVGSFTSKLFHAAKENHYYSNLIRKCKKVFWKVIDYLLSLERVLTKVRILCESILATYLVPKIFDDVKILAVITISVRGAEFGIPFLDFEF